MKFNKQLCHFDHAVITKTATIKNEFYLEPSLPEPASDTQNQQILEFPTFLVTFSDALSGPGASQLWPYIHKQRVSLPYIRNVHRSEGVIAVAQSRGIIGFVIPFHWKNHKVWKVT